METSITQAVQEQPQTILSTIYPNKLTRQGTFDVAPTLDAINFCGPEEFAKVLDDIMYDLGQYYLEKQGEAVHSHSARYVFYLRLLRNAVLKGGGYIDFDEM